MFASKSAVNSKWQRKSVIRRNQCEIRPKKVTSGASNYNDNRTLSNTKLGTLQKYLNRDFDLIEQSTIKEGCNRNVLNINELMTFDSAIVTLFKFVNQLCPEGLQNSFIGSSTLSNCNTRNRKNLHVQKLKLEPTKRSFCIQVQRRGIVPHNPPEMVRPLYDLKKSWDLTFWASRH